MVHRSPSLPIDSAVPLMYAPPTIVASIKYHNYRHVDVCFHCVALASIRRCGIIHTAALIKYTNYHYADVLLSMSGMENNNKKVVLLQI